MIHVVEIMRNLEIRTRQQPVCPVCGSLGRALYEGLVDTLFNAPGEWRVRQCDARDCGTLWLDPMPLPDELHKAYSNYYTHEDVEPPKDWIAKLVQSARDGYRSRRFKYEPKKVSIGGKWLGFLVAVNPVIRDYLNYPFVFFQGLSQKGRLLEVGCGNGDGLVLLSEWGWEAEGIDFDPKAVSNARGKGLHAYEGDLFSRKYASGSFDAVFSNHVIEHVPDPKSTLGEIFRILAPGGRCILVTPNANSLMHMLFRSDWRGLEPPRHLHVFTRGALEKLAESAGFQRVKVISLTRGAAWMYWASRAIREGRGVQWEYSFHKKMLGIFLHLAVSLYCAVKRDGGEELVLIGER